MSNDGYINPEPDYEQVYRDREERRGEARLEREDRRVGRVEDWRATKPKESTE